MSRDRIPGVIELPRANDMKRKIRKNDRSIFGPLRVGGHIKHER